MNELSDEVIQLWRRLVEPHTLYNSPPQSKLGYWSFLEIKGMTIVPRMLFKAFHVCTVISNRSSTMGVAVSFSVEKNGRYPENEANFLPKGSSMKNEQH